MDPGGAVLCMQLDPQNDKKYKIRSGTVCTATLFSFSK